MKIKNIMAAALCTGPLLAFAQMTPLGKWQGIDEGTQKPIALFRIFEKEGALFGVVEKDLTPPTPGYDPLCSKCTDDRKNKPKVGLEVIRDAKPVPGKEEWADGTILDPNDGKSYRLTMVPIEGGKKLQVRGYIAFFYRTQIWNRVE